MVVYEQINIPLPSFCMMNTISSAITLVSKNHFLPTIDVPFEQTQSLCAYLWFHLSESLSECRKLHPAELTSRNTPTTNMLTETRPTRRSSAHHPAVTLTCLIPGNPPSITLRQLTSHKASGSQLGGTSPLFHFPLFCLPGILPLCSLSFLFLSLSFLHSFLFTFCCLPLEHRGYSAVYISKSKLKLFSSSRVIFIGSLYSLTMECACIIIVLQFFIRWLCCYCFC